MHLSDRERYQVETVIRTICSEKSIERSVDVRKQILKFLETSDGWREFEIRISRNFGENVDIIVDEIRSILKRKIRRSSTDMDDGKKRQKKDSIRRRSVSRNSESRSKIVKDSLLNKNDDIFFTEQQIDPDWQNGLPGRDERLPGRDERLLDYQRRGNYDVGWRNQRSREFEGYYRQDNYRLPPGVPQGGPPGYVLPPGSPPGGPAPGGGGSIHSDVPWRRSMPVYDGLYYDEPPPPGPPPPGRFRHDMSDRPYGRYDVYRGDGDYNSHDGHDMYRRRRLTHPSAKKKGVDLSEHSSSQNDDEDPSHRQRVEKNVSPGGMYPMIVPRCHLTLETEAYKKQKEIKAQKAVLRAKLQKILENLTNVLKNTLSLLTNPKTPPARQTELKELAQKVKDKISSVTSQLKAGEEEELHKKLAKLEKEASILGVSPGQIHFRAVCATMNLDLRTTWIQVHGVPEELFEDETKLVEFLTLGGSLSVSSMEELRLDDGVSVKFVQRSEAEKFRKKAAELGIRVQWIEPPSANEDQYDPSQVTPSVKSEKAQLINLTETPDEEDEDEDEERRWRAR
eukprot:GHVL01000231.1.p1 GENE.GHVL01000231.1~~GHVL01000231.1.p1  ORF type:complete len:587 (+),score=161.78 GHVL01000231.1:66-1763(+)